MCARVCLNAWCVCLHLYVCLPNAVLFVCLSVCLFVCLSVCLFVCLSVCLFVCLSAICYLLSVICCLLVDCHPGDLDGHDSSRSDTVDGDVSTARRPSQSSTVAQLMAQSQARRRQSQREDEHTGDRPLPILTPRASKTRVSDAAVASGPYAQQPIITLNPRKLMNSVL